MKFNLEESMTLLKKTPKILHVFLNDLNAEWLMNNEGSETWSPYNVVGHLIYGEKTDWLIRAKIIMGNSRDKTFEPYNRFAQQNDDPNVPIEELLTQFETLRTQNLKELVALNITEKDLNRKGVHPELGDVTLENLLSAWVVHDLGHIAQISRVMAKQYKDAVGPWTAYLKIIND